jgi:transposase
VYVWAGISIRGATGICIFEGIMDKELFAEILDKTLVPYLHDFETHRFMQDNDPKHTLHYVADFLDLNCINWWKTPPESPDFNPIENLRHELKEFI